MSDWELVLRAYFPQSGPYALLVHSRGSVTFSFDAGPGWNVSFYTMYKGTGNAQVTASYGTASRPQ
jgi:hypothetical protein